MTPRRRLNLLIVLVVATASSAWAVDSKSTGAIPILRLDPNASYIGAIENGVWIPLEHDRGFVKAGRRTGFLAWLRNSNRSK